MRSTAVVALTGLSYRRLDYLTRQHPLDQLHPELTAGSGCRRYWPTLVVAQLMVAGTLVEQVPELDLPTVAGQLLTGPKPPDRGWVVLRPHQEPAVIFCLYARELPGALTGPGAAVVARIDLRPLRDFLDMAEAERALERVS